MTYSCKRCSYKTNNYLDIKRHIIKKKLCEKNKESYEFSDDQLLILSLISDNDYDFYIETYSLNNLDKSNKIFKKRFELFNILENIDKNKLKKCEYCNTKFSKIILLRNHILTECFPKKIIEEYEFINNHTIENNKSALISNSIINQNSNNITNIYLEINRPEITPVPFDQEWNISKINKDFQDSLMISSIMYTRLLENILENEINLNVIIDKDSSSGIVYKNDIDKYIKMKSKDIVDKTMDKLKNHLLNFNKEKQDDFYFKETLTYSRRMIEKKYIDYIKDTDIHKKVIDVISNIFENKKQDAINILKKIDKDNDFLGY